MRQISFTHAPTPVGGVGVGHSDGGLLTTIPIKTCL